MQHSNEVTAHCGMNIFYLSIYFTLKWTHFAGQVVLELYVAQAGL